MNNRERRKQRQAERAAADLPIAQSETQEQADQKLANFAHVKRQQEKMEERGTMAGLPPLPKIPKSSRKSKPPKPCECGCGGMTKGGRFIPGHDAYLHALALRVERGIIAVKDIEGAGHQLAVKKLLNSGEKIHNSKGKPKAVAQ